MKRIIAAVLCCVLAVQAHAASRWECAIWLCAPVGFALNDCDKALRAMWKRMLRFKSAFPSWRSCSIDPQVGGMSAQFFLFALVDDPVIGRVMVIDHYCLHEFPSGRDDPQALTVPWCTQTLLWFRVLQHGEQFMGEFAMNKRGGAVNIEGIPHVTVDQITKPNDTQYCAAFPRDPDCVQ